MNHKNILKLFDYLKISNMVYLLLEYANEGNLTDYLINNQNLSDEQMATLFYQICKSVEHVHQKGFIHRDLKPENILLDSDNNLKLCDFGWSAHELNFEFL